MFRRLAGISLLLLGVGLLVGVMTLDEEMVPFPKFGGLNTIGSDRSMKVGEARVDNNIDHARNLDAITKRYGYDSVCTREGVDSLTGLYGVYWSWGQSQLAFSADSEKTIATNLIPGYGGVYLTKVGSANLDGATKIWNYWNCQHPTQFAMFEDRLYAVNGVQKGVVWDGIKARSFPLHAPGEPRLVPITSAAAHGLSGEYRYAIKADAYDTSGDTLAIAQGYLTQPVTVNGHVLLTWFPYIQNDTLVFDSMRVYIYRTTANPGRTTDTTKVYLITEAGWFAGLKLTNGSGFTATVEDSVPDSLITGNASVNIVSTTQYGIDSTGARTRAYGAPSIIDYGWQSYDTTVWKVQDTAHGIFWGIPKQKDTGKVKVCYTVTFYDSLTNSESDTGRSIFAANYADTNEFLQWVKMKFPPCGEDTSRLVRRIYRAHYLEATRDTVILLHDRIPDIVHYTWYLQSYRRTYGEDNVYATGSINSGWAIWLKSVVGDTMMMTPYYLVKELPLATDSLVDSVRYDSLMKCPQYYRSTAPPGLKGIFAYQGQLFGWEGSRLWMSQLDSGTAWGQMSFIDINKDDGSEITVAYPTRTCIVVKKDGASFNVYQDANGNWTKVEISNHIGCIAPYSHASGVGGEYYLSQFGVMRENPGAYMERTQAVDLASAPLKNFDVMSITTKNKARSFYMDQKYLLSVPFTGTDTTYIYDDKAGTWGTWTNFPIGGATLYRAASQVDFTPADTMYFYKPNKPTLWRYKSSETDNGTQITWTWQSGPILFTPEWKTITAFGLWRKGVLDSTLNEYTYNQNDSLLDNRRMGATVVINKTTPPAIDDPGDTNTVDTIRAERYEQFAVPNNVFGLMFSIRLTYRSVTATPVDGFEVYYRRHPNVVRR